MNINSNTAPFVLINTKMNTWLVLYNHIAQLMTHKTNVYIVGAYLEIMLLGLLAYYIA